MNYLIRVRMRYPWQGLMKGIYRIWFGNKFYIGSTNRFAQRMSAHERGINECLSTYPMPKNHCAQYLRLARYLHENPKIYTVYAEVIQKCVTAQDLYHYENLFLYEASFNPDCVNGIFRATTKVLRSIDTWDLEMRSDGLHYFDPTNKDAESFRADTLLTNSGTVARARKHNQLPEKPDPIPIDEIPLIKICKPLKMLIPCWKSRIE